MSIVIVAALLALSDASEADAFERGAAWANSEISAQCLIEVATLTNDQAILRTDKGRAAAAMKAQVLAGYLAKSADASDALYEAVKRSEPHQRDLLDHGLITDKEFDDKVGEPLRSVNDSVANSAKAMRQFEHCDFFRLINKSYTVSRARARQD